MMTFYSKVISALCLIGSASASAPPVESLHSYSFEEYVKDYSKVYENESEFEMRKFIFAERLAHILKHNQEASTWVENVNQFTDLTQEEQEARRGIDKSMLFHSRSLKTGMKPSHVDLTSLPDSVDWRDEGVVTAIKDQGFCGSCWAFAATECLESHIAIETGLLFTLSEEEFVGCVENPNECGGSGGCLGAISEMAYEYAMDNGLVTEWETPYVSYTSRPADSKCTLTDLTPQRVATISGYVTNPTNSYEDLMQSVATKGPIAITVDASAWGSYAGGIFDGCNQENPDLDHGVLLVGYGTDNGQDYWLVRNSWGPTWGEKGYIRLARTSDEGSRCGVDVNPADGTGCAGGPSNVTVCGTCGILYDTSYPTGGALK